MPDQNATAHAPAGSDRLDPALISLGAVVALGTCTALLDMTMVNVALTGLIRTFDAPVGTVQWVLTGYLLAVAVVIPTTGWSVERFGTRTMWTFALAVFLIGSLLCGAAWSAGSLIAFRVVQGVGGGMLVPLGMTILAQAAGPRRRGRVMSIVAVPAQVAPLAGPLLGGLVVDAAGWRWIFYLNVPICAAALLLARRIMPPDARSDPGPLDVRGLALLAPALVALSYGLHRMTVGTGLTDGTALGSLGLGVTALVAFAVHALRSTALSPVLDLRLFGHRALAAAATLNFMSRMTIFGATLLIPLYYQVVRGEPALVAGLLLAPQSLGTMLALPLVGRLTDRVGARPVVLAGVAVTALGALAYTRLGAHTDELLLAGSLLVWGLGVAATTVPVTAGAYVGLPPSAIPRASSALTTVQTVGASFGAALLATLLQYQLAAHRSATGPPAPFEATGFEATGFEAAAFATTFWWIVAATALAAVPALFLPRTS